MNTEPGQRHFDLALKAGVKVLNRLDATPDTHKTVLLSWIAYTILDAIQEAEQRRRPVAPSRN